MSRKLEDLIPILAIKAKQLIDESRDILGIDIIITDTWRSFAEQKALYDQGRTTPGNIVTYANAGDSYHNYGLAFDFAVMKDGKITWSELNLYKQVGEYAEDMNLQWGGRFKRPVDMPHIQDSFGFTIHELKTFYTLGGIQRVWEECNKKYEQGLWP